MKNNNGIKVLVVDDEPKWRKIHATNLKKWGYTPVLAEGFGKFLEEDAVQKCISKECHLVLLDLNLYDQPNNQAGFDLIEKLAPATPIIVTGSNSKATLRKAYRNYDAFYFVSKDDDSNRLKNVLVEATEEEWENFERPTTENVEIGWSEELEKSTLLTQRFRDNGLNIADKEIIMLLRRHFKDIKNVTLHYKSRNIETESVTIDRRSQSAVFVANRVSRDENEMQPVFIKIASRENIRIESENYQEYLHKKDVVPDNSYARIKKCTFLWNIGIIEYELVNLTRHSGKQLVSNLSEFLSERDIPSINSILDRLFDDIVKPWHLIEPDKQPKLKKQNPKEITINNHSIESFIKGLGEKYQKVPYEASFPKRTQVISHGRLTTHNVLIREDLPVITNYSKMGFGTPFWDFVTLEIDIVLNLTRESNLERLERFFRVLLPNQMRDFYHVQSTAESIESYELLKLVACINLIRKQAVDQIGFGDVTEYYWHLLAAFSERIKSDFPLEDTDQGNLYFSLVCEVLKQPNVDLIERQTLYREDIPIQRYIYVKRKSNKSPNRQNMLNDMKNAIEKTEEFIKH